MKRYRRKHNLNRIKSEVAYEYHEIAWLLNVSKSTVRHWVKLGLPAFQAKRPPLVKGAHLKEFLKDRQSKHKAKCQPDELYCLTCRQPRRAWEGIVDVFVLNEKKIRVTGLCEVCERSLSKMQPMKNVPKIVQIFRVQQWHDGHLIERMHPSLNYHLHKE